MISLKNTVRFTLLVIVILLSGCVGAEQQHASINNSTNIEYKEVPINITDKSISDLGDINTDNQSIGDLNERVTTNINNQGIDEYGGDNFDENNNDFDS